MLASLAACRSEGAKTAQIDQGLRLRDVAESAGLQFGSAYDTVAITDPAYGDLLVRHAGILVTDYSLKFKPLRRNSPDADFTTADRIVAFARNNGIPVRGHNLIWNEGNPAWLVRATQAERVYWLERHIVEVMDHYHGQMHSWDVVNEPFWPDHRKLGGFRDGPWYEAMGSSYIRKAFEVATRADPDVRLVLNEAWVERTDLLGQSVRKGLFELLQDLLAAGVRLSAVGLQCHLRPLVSMSLPVLSDFLYKLSELPIDVYISELDIDDGGMSGDVDAQIGAIYGQFVSMIKLHSNVKILCTWQLADKYSFYRDKYKRPVRTLPFDENLQAKIAVQEIVSALQKS